MKENNGNSLFPGRQAGLLELLNITADEIGKACAGDFPLADYITGYFFDRDILQVRKNEWVVCMGGVSAANTIDRQPLTFKTKEDAVAWVHDNNEDCAIRFVEECDNYVLMCLTAGRESESMGHGTVCSVTTLTEKTHKDLIRRTSEKASAQICEAFWRNQIVPDYAARLICHYFECLRQGMMARLTEIDGANDAVPPRD